MERKRYYKYVRKNLKKNSKKLENICTCAKETKERGKAWKDEKQNNTKENWGKNERRKEKDRKTERLKD